MSDPAVLALLQEMKATMSTKEDTLSIKKDILEQMGTKFDEVANRQERTENIIDQLTTKFAMLEGRVSQMETQQADAELSDGNVHEPVEKKAKMGAPSSSSAGRPPTPSGGRPSGPPPRHQESNESFNDRMMWIKGFPRDIPRDILTAHGKALVGRLMPSLEGSQVVVTSKPFARQYSLEFTTKTQAVSFREKAKELKVSWVDPRSKEDVPLKCQADISLAGRIVNSVLYKVYPLVEQTLKDLGKFTPKTKMGNMGRPRTFFVAGDDGDPYVFWTLNVDQDKQTTMVPNYDEMMAWGITKEMADSIASEAVKNAMGRRQ